MPAFVRAVAAALAERLGYRRAWVYDSPALYHDAFMTLARCADRTTTTIGLGTGVMIPNLRHPMDAAASVASLVDLAPDRVAIGIGTGFSGRAALGRPALRWRYVEVNDMIAGPDGSAYVTQFGREMWDTDTAFEPTVMIRVAPDGAVEVGADDLMVPNGVAVADDGKSLVVAESAAARLSRYSVRDGLLSDRVNVPLTPAADMPFVAPDGICLDAEGGIWAADPLARRVVHLSDDTIDQEIPLEDFPLACVLGGEDRRTLFVCTNRVWSKHDRQPTPTGSVVSVRADVPGPGRHDGRRGPGRPHRRGDGRRFRPRRGDGPDVRRGGDGRGRARHRRGRRPGDRHEPGRGVRRADDGRALRRGRRRLGGGGRQARRRGPRGVRPAVRQRRRAAVRCDRPPHRGGPELGPQRERHGHGAHGPRVPAAAARPHGLAPHPDHRRGARRGDLRGRARRRCAVGELGARGRDDRPPRAHAGDRDHGRRHRPGIWAMFDYVEFPAAEGGDRFGLKGYGHYIEEYVREDGEWRIKRLELSRLRVDPLGQQRG